MSIKLDLLENMPGRLKKQFYKYSHVYIYSLIKRIKKSEVGSRLANGALWSIIGNIVSRVSLLLSLIIVARILGQAEYGRIGIVRSTIGTFMVFACFAMSTTVSKFVSQYRLEFKLKTASIIYWAIVSTVILGGLLTFFLLLSSHFIASYIINEPSLVSLLRIASFILFLSALESVFQGVLAGFENFKKIAIANIISGIISLPCFILLTHYIGGSGAIWGFVIRIGLTVVCMTYFTVFELQIRQIRPAATYERECLALLFSFGIPVFIGGLIPPIVFWVVNIFLVQQCNYNEMATFDAANQFRLGIITLHQTAGMIMLPVLSNLFIHNEISFHKIAGKIIIINAALAFVIVLIFSILSPWLMLLFGKSYKSSYLVLVFLVITSGLGIVCDIYKKILISQNKVWSNLIATFLMGLMLLSTSFFLVKYGALGVSISYFISFTLFLSVLVLISSFNKKLEANAYLKME